MNTVKSHRKMGFIGHAFHLTMCCFTMGLWIPVYASRIRSRTTVTQLPPVQQYQVYAPQQQPQYPQYRTWQ